jgi:hypothetical protein
MNDAPDRQRGEAAFAGVVDRPSSRPLTLTIIALVIGTLGVASFIGSLMFALQMEVLDRASLLGQIAAILFIVVIFSWIPSGLLAIAYGTWTGASWAWAVTIGLAGTVLLSTILWMVEGAHLEHVEYFALSGIALAIIGLLVLPPVRRLYEWRR